MVAVLTAVGDSPAGIVAVTGHEIRVLDHRLGSTREVPVLPYTPGMARVLWW